MRKKKTGCLFAGIVWSLILLLGLSGTGEVQAATGVLSTATTSVETTKEETGETSGAYEGTISQGVFVREVDLGGKNAEQAREALDAYEEKLQGTTLRVNVGDKDAEITLGELGVGFAEEDVITEALETGKSGNLIRRYKTQKDLEYEPLVIELPLTLDAAKVDTFLEEQVKKLEEKAKNAGVVRENGTFSYTKEVIGHEVDKVQTADTISTAVQAVTAGKEFAVQAVTEVTNPTVDLEEAKNCNTVIGTFTTNFGSSSSSRASNLATGAQKINGSVVYPGETFSVYETLQPFTVDNGYSMAGAYLNGKVVDSMGGGVCQVSTTLYNAILYAEMEVTQRSEHSMLVNYVEPARDAAISGTVKDLKFVNNTETPIYIEGYTKNRNITFTVYGKAKEPGREVELVSVTTGTRQPGKEKVTKDPTLPEGYRKVTQSAHIGKTATLYRVIKQDGKEVSREVVNNSSYMSSPQYVTIGTKKATVEEPEETEEPEEPEEPAVPEEPVVPEEPIEEE